MIGVKTIIFSSLFLAIFYLVKKILPLWTNRVLILFVTVITIYMTYLLSLDLPAGLLNLLSLTFLSLEMFHILDVVGNNSKGIKAGKRVDLPANAIPYTPKVSIHVPICNEPVEVVRKTLEALSQLDYPDYEVCVLVNNTTESELIEPIAELCRNLGERFRFFHLPYVKGYKAGTLNYALRVTDRDAEIIAVVDSDYIVDRNFLKDTIGYFKDPATAIVQLPQDYRDFPKRS
jgi:cellulose synthase/poly-beta-1,6-N-acetylglucosamine synthase-like glycosyltransferase